jgi:hypothetical protein
MYKFILIFFLFFIKNLFAINTYFIGTYTEKNDYADAYLNKFDLNNRWELSKLTEKLLKTKFKNQLKTLNISLKDDFNTNINQIVSKGDIRNRKLGFFYLKTYQNIQVRKGNNVTVHITFNLTFVQLGEESNRLTQDDTFEALYTHGVTVLIHRAIDEKYTLEETYKKGLEESLKKLLNSMIKDKQTKKTNALISDDILFTIQDFKINKKLLKDINNIFKSNINAKHQLLIMLQENLIKKIRADKTLDDVVLLYPDILNKYILSNWEEYLIRIKEVTTNTLKNENAQIIIRHIKPACEKKEFDGQNRYMNGYFIQPFLSDLKDEITFGDDFQSARASYTAVISRIIQPIKKGLIYDATSTPDNIVKKIKLFAADDAEGYVVAKNMDNQRYFEIIRGINSSINKLSDKLVKQIKQIVKVRKNHIFRYEDYCKE